MTDIPQAVVEKYIKVRRLAERGEEGERRAAARIAQRMEQQYPGISELVKDGKGQGENSFPGGQRGRQRGPSGPKGPSRPSSPLNWQSLFGQAAEIFSTFQSAFDKASSMAYARLLARRSSAGKIFRRRGDIVVQVRVPVDSVAEAMSLSSVQQEFFKQGLCDLFAEQVEEMMAAAAHYRSYRKTRQ